jgi:hypothetical protein
MEGSEQLPTKENVTLGDTSVDAPTQDVVPSESAGTQTAAGSPSEESGAAEAPVQDAAAVAEAQTPAEGAEVAAEPEPEPAAAEQDAAALENASAPAGEQETATTAESADTEGQAPDVTGLAGEQAPGAPADQQPADTATPTSHETPGVDRGYLGARATDPEHRAGEPPQTTAHHLEAMARGYVGELAREAVDMVHEGRHILVPRPAAEGE